MLNCININTCYEYVVSHKLRCHLTADSGLQPIPRKDLDCPVNICCIGLAHSAEVPGLTELLILAFGNVMKREQVDRLVLTMQAGDKFSSRSQVGGIVINSTDQWQANLDIRAVLRQSGKIFQDQAVVNPGVAFVLLGVDHFQVIQEKVGMGRHPEQRLSPGISRGVDSAMDLSLPAGLEHLDQEIGIEQRLAAGECNAAT